MAKRLVIISVVVLLMVLGVYGFKTFFEPWEKTIDLGFSREARLNPFLAAEHYLAQIGYDVQSDDNAGILNDLSAVSTLLISQAEIVRSESRSKLLEAWLLQGGHLIVEAPEASRLEQHVLLAPYAISRIKPATNELKTDGPNHPPVNELAAIIEQASDSTSLIPPEQLTQILFEDTSEPVTVHFSPDFILDYQAEQQASDASANEHLPLYQAGSDTGVHFIQFQVGEGLLTIISDSGIWHSKRIDQFDHAYLLHALSSRRGGDEQMVRIVRGTQMPPLTTMVWQAAPELVIATGALLMAWLVYRSRRFGAVQEPDFSRRRAISEHIRAAADFLWRHQRYAALLEPLQQEIAKKAHQRYPNHQSDENKFYFFLAERTGSTTGEIRLAMSVPDKMNETMFVRQVTLLQKIRESL